MEIKSFKLSDDLYYWGDPESVSIELTNRCNLRCEHCFRTVYQFSKGDMDYDLFWQLTPELKNAGNLNLSVSGESMLSPLFHDALEWTIQQGIPVSFTTNGVMLHQVFDLMDTGNITINVSLDAASSASYKRIRGNGFSRIIENLKKIRAIKIKRGDGFPRIMLTCVVWKENIHELDKLIDLADELSADVVICYHRIYYDYQTLKNSSLYYDQNAFDAMVKKAKQNARKCNISFIHPRLFSDIENANTKIGHNYLTGKPDQFDCSWIYKNFTIAYNGIAFACCFVDRLAMGDLTSSTIRDIWNGSNYRKLRSQIRNRFYPPACRNCMFRQVLTVESPDVFYSPIDESSLFSKSLIKEERNKLNELNGQYRSAIESIRHCHLLSAEASLKELIENEPLCHEAWNGLGVISAINGNKAYAIESFQKAIDLVPSYNFAIFNLEKVN